MQNKNYPLIVDLDGTLLKTDLPYESFVFVLKNYPLQFLNIVGSTFWAKLLKKPVSFKIKLENQARALSLKDMPWSEKVLQFLKNNKQQKKILCTGSTQGYAEQVQKKLGLFDEVYGSQIQRRITGRNKSQFLLKKYGYKQFDYIGNSLADLKIASVCRNFFLINPNYLTYLFSKKYPVKKIFKDKQKIGLNIITCFGLIFWLLNSILWGFVFLWDSSLSHKIMVSGFLSFSFMATSALLFFNCLFVAQDRKTTNTSWLVRHNIFIKGAMSLQAGLLNALLFFGLAWAVCSLFELYFSGLLVYFCSIGGCMRYRTTQRAWFFYFIPCMIMLLQLFLLL